MGADPIRFETAPEKYRHWKLACDGAIATLSMDVQEDGGLVPGYAMKLNSYDLGVDIELAAVRPTPARWREATQLAFRGEWYRTGDRAVRESDGRYRILGRADDLMKVSGQWVGPGEVEDVIAQVAGVRECAVVGRSGAGGLLELVAFVAAAEPDAPPPPQAILDRCASALPRFKRPREVRFLESLPRTATGKLQRFRLRELAEAPIQD